MCRCYSDSSWFIWGDSDLTFVIFGMWGCESLIFDLLLICLQCVRGDVWIWRFVSVVDNRRVGYSARSPLNFKKRVLFQILFSYTREIPAQLGSRLRSSVGLATILFPNIDVGSFSKKIGLTYSLTGTRFYCLMIWDAIT